MARPLIGAEFTNVHAARGTAASLIELARPRLDPGAGPLLYLSGFQISRDLVSALAPDGFAVDRIVVYWTNSAREVSVRLQREMAEGRIDAALFLSVRTAATFRDLLMASGLADFCSRMTAVAFSAYIVQTLRPLRFQRVEIAASPHLKEMVDAVLRVRVN